jgi:tetratricopeptide (TPR) repeat protein
MIRRSLLLAAVLLSSLLLLYSCDDDDGGPTGLTAAELTDQGWTKFQAADFAGASADFKAATHLDPEFADAYLGLGWAELRRSNAGMAEDALETYLTMVSGSDNANAGLVLAYHAQDKFQDAIGKASLLLSSNPGWSFYKDASVDYLDIALVLAHSYYEIAEYQQSLDVVKQYFDPNFDPDLGTDAGRDELAAKLESLYTG